MESILLQIDEKIVAIKNTVKNIRSLLAGNDVSRSLADNFTHFDLNLGLYLEAIKSEDLSSIANTAKTVTIYSQSIAYAVLKINNLSQNINFVASELLKISIDLQNMIDDSPIDRIKLDYDNSEESIDLQSFQSIKKNLSALALEQDRIEKKINRLSTESEAKLDFINDFVKSIDIDAKKKIEDSEQILKEFLSDIEEKRDQINKILEHTSGRVIAGDFEESAKDERKVADQLRYGSLACMILSILIVSSIFWTQTGDSLNAHIAIFKTILAFMLSIPSAYLARESAKHREHQRSHHQTSLDLKAITPYISTLPEHDQNKIKTEIADRIFAANRFNKFGTDSYPVNIHEILMEIVKRFGPKK